MSELLFLSEYVEAKRTAHVLKNLTTKEFIVYCFCCGNEAESEPFATESDAEDWAEDWVQKTVELPAFEALAEEGGCGCSNH